MQWGGILKNRLKRNQPDLYLNSLSVFCRKIWITEKVEIKNIPIKGLWNKMLGDILRAGTA